MVMQGIAEIIRCIICIRDGEWPQRLHDVEEIERSCSRRPSTANTQVVEELEEIGLRKGDI